MKCKNCHSFLQQTKTSHWKNDPPSTPFSILFFRSSNIVVLSAMVHATRKRKLCQLPSWKAEADGKKCWASKMEEMKSITLEIFFWKAFWKDMDGFWSPPVRGQNIYEGLRFNLLWKPTWANKTSNKPFWRPRLCLYFWHFGVFNGGLSDSGEPSWLV